MGKITEGYKHQRGDNEHKHIMGKKREGELNVNDSFKSFWTLFALIHET